MNPTRQKLKSTTQHTEQGYALIALVGILMFALILTTAAAPMVKREAQREKEEEMLWRGDQIQRAIAQYVLTVGGGQRYPTNLKRDLVDGVKVGPAAKPTRFLRASALCDPLKPCVSGESNWHMVYQGDGEPKVLRDAILDYMGKENSGLKPLNTPFQLLEAEALRSAGQLAGGASPGLQLGGDSDDKLKEKPIVGVTSNGTGKMFRSYYGIDDYDKALFFPQVGVVTGGIIPPKGISAAFTSAGSNVPRCPDGGPMINGSCEWGRLRGGICPPPKRVNPQSGQCE